MSKKRAKTNTLVAADAARLVPPPIAVEMRLSTGQWGILAFLFSEVALFSTLIVTYLAFFGRDGQPGGLGGPTPQGTLSLPLALGTTACLLASSLSIHLADHAARKRGRMFLPLWIVTIALGSLFLLGTTHEWKNLILRDHLTLGRNLFGTTFYTLVGFHALHVTIGVIVMLIVLSLSLSAHLARQTHATVQLVSWYWHFVDGVWIVVFAVVYVLPHIS